MGEVPWEGQDGLFASFRVQLMGQHLQQSQSAEWRSGQSNLCFVVAGAG